jgi:hypothetical protein
VIVLAQAVIMLEEDDKGRLVPDLHVFWEKDLGLELVFSDG